MEATNNKNTIFLTQVPLDINTVHNIKGHFNVFGEIKNVQVGYNGDQRAAFVEFCNRDAANNAYRNKEWILDARCIKKSRHPIKPVHAPVSSTSISDSKTMTVGYECTVCQQLLCSATSLQQHMKNKHISFECKLCSIVCESKNSYRKHHNDLHNDKKNANGETVSGQKVLSLAAESTSTLLPPTANKEPVTPLAMADTESLLVQPKLASTSTKNTNRANEGKNPSIATKRRASEASSVKQPKTTEGLLEVIARLERLLASYRDSIDALNKEKSTLQTKLESASGRARDMQRQRDLNCRVHGDIVKRLKMKLARSEELLAKMRSQEVQVEMNRRDQLISEQKRQLQLAEMQIQNLQRTLAEKEHHLQCAGYYNRPDAQFNNGQWRQFYND